VMVFDTINNTSPDPCSIFCLVVNLYHAKMVDR
jgi:hypothetical protein